MERAASGEKEKDEGVLYEYLFERRRRRRRRGKKGERVRGNPNM